MFEKNALQFQVELETCLEFMLRQLCYVNTCSKVTLEQLILALLVFDSNVDFFSSVFIFHISLSLLSFTNFMRINIASTLLQL